MKSWKTSLGGVIFAIGGVTQVVVEIAQALSNSENPKLRSVGIMVATLGGALMGLAARDNNKTSEQVGAKGV